MGENWYVYLLIITVLFSGDGSINKTENAVLIATMFALSMTYGCEGNRCGAADDDDT